LEVVLLPENRHSAWWAERCEEVRLAIYHPSHMAVMLATIAGLKMENAGADLNRT